MKIEMENYLKIYHVPSYSFVKNDKRNEKSFSKKCEVNKIIYNFYLMERSSPIKKPSQTTRPPLVNSHLPVAQQKPP